MFLKHTVNILFIPVVLLLASCADSNLFSNPTSDDDDIYTTQVVPEKNTYSHSSSKEKIFFSIKQNNLVEASVVDIDYIKRVVSLSVYDKQIQLLVTQAARNFNMISVGDLMMIDHIVNLSIEVMDVDSLDSAVRKLGGISVSEESEVPEKMAKIKKTVIATVMSINRAANTFELQGPGGVIIEYTADETDKLGIVEVDDVVAITQTQIMSIYLQIPVVEPS
jgi:hypothetical protein